MPNETDHKLMEILRILADQNKTIGAKKISDELKNKGYYLGERAVRYHMKLLDEKGFTERKGNSGRILTDKGLNELNKGLVYDQVDFIFSRIEDLIHQTSFDCKTKQGTVVVNTSIIESDKEAIDVLYNVVKKNLSVSSLIKLQEFNNEEIKVTTICGTTIDGMLLNMGVPSIPQYGGLVKVEDFVPVEFKELISYKGSSITPLEAFTSKNSTSILDIINNGEGLIPANFRIVPHNSKNDIINLFNNLNKNNIDGLLKIGNKGESVLGAPVDMDMIGIALIGGISPLCAVQEAGFITNIKLARGLVDINTLKPLSNIKTILKKSITEPKNKLSFVLAKSLNLIQKMDFDLESQSGNLIANISYINKEDIDSCIEIMAKVYKKRPEFCISPFFKIINHKSDKQLQGIVTICSLSLDAILIKNRILSTPKYGGILEITDESYRFVELTSYIGSSLDPHEIYISKRMTSIMDAINNEGRILASLKEIPYSLKDKSETILNDVEDIGFSILNIGKPGELIYNSKVDRYNIGIVASSGLNPIAAIKEEGFFVKPKAIETLTNLNEMDRF